MLSNCPHCKGLGWVRFDVPVGDPDFGKLVPCPDMDAHLEERKEEWYARSGLKPHEHYKLDDLVYIDDMHQEMVGVLTEFLEDPKGWLYLWGGYGTCKSVALQCAVSTFIERGTPAYYAMFADLLDVAKNSFKKPERKTTEDYDEAWSKWTSYEARLHRMRHLPLLAVDEVDTDKLNPTPWMRQFQDQLFEHRYRMAFGDARLVTMFAGNNSPDLLPGWMASRVKDTRFIVYENKGVDIRQQGTLEWFHE